MPRFDFRLPDIKSVAKFMGFYGAGVVTAGFFLSGPGEYAGRFDAAEQRPAIHEQHRQAASQPAPAETAAPAAAAAASPTQERAPAAAREPEPNRQVRVIPIVRPDRTTDGFGGERREATRDVASDADADEDAAPADCNVSACRAQYRSFDARTCTYRSYEGTTKRCTR